MINRHVFRTHAFRTLCITVVVGCGACAVPVGAPSEAPPLASVEIPADLVEETIELTRRLIQQAPVNPPGDEVRVAQIVGQRLANAGISVEIRAFSETPGRANVIAKLPGSRGDELKPILLVGHSDVVPAAAEDWQRGKPFEAVVDNGVLVGRGSLDMLGMVALEALTLIALQRSDVERARDIYLIVAGDEEVDGIGMQAALKAWPELTNARWAINEGSFMVQDYFQEGEDLAAIAVAEKGAFQFRLTTTGPAGHGSTPTPDDAPARLIAAVSRVVDAARPLRITDEAALMFASLGAARGGLSGFVMARPTLLGALGRGTLEKTSTTSALVHDTCALTQLDAGYKRNVIPSKAEAVFDCRLLPGTDPEAFGERVRSWIADENVSINVLYHTAANGSPSDDLLFDALAARLKRERPGLAVIPILTKGITDSRFLRPHGVVSYGFIPVRVTKDELDAIHGVDERVRIDELKAALPRLVDVTAALAADTSKP